MRTVRQLVQRRAAGLVGQLLPVYLDLLIVPSAGYGATIPVRTVRWSLFRRRRGFLQGFALQVTPYREPQDDQDDEARDRDAGDGAPAELPRGLPGRGAGVGCGVRVRARDGGGIDGARGARARRRRRRRRRSGLGCEDAEGLALRQRPARLDDGLHQQHVVEVLVRRWLEAARDGPEVRDLGRGAGCAGDVGPIDGVVVGDARERDRCVLQDVVDEAVVPVRREDEVEGCAWRRRRPARAVGVDDARVPPHGDRVARLEDGRGRGFEEGRVERVEVGGALRVVELTAAAHGKNSTATKRDETIRDDTICESLD
ncbi:hypothetical protein F4802DRAFT_568934 [Xylaria palmicola]|nr:hypothetical protein F4802DRAFT_568934 [Xylaria palmicola]